MICPECLTWPVTAENEICSKCQREIDSLEPAKPVDFSLHELFHQECVQADVRHMMTEEETAKYAARAKVLSIDYSDIPDHFAVLRGVVENGQFFFTSIERIRRDQLHEIAKLIHVPQHLLHA